MYTLLEIMPLQHSCTFKYKTLKNAIFAVLRKVFVDSSQYMMTTKIFKCKKSHLQRKLLRLPVGLLVQLK